MIHRSAVVIAAEAVDKRWYEVLAPWAAVLAALVAASSAALLAARSRRHEEAKQLRERMLLASEEALVAFQEAGQAISGLLGESRPRNEAFASAHASAVEACRTARARAARVALLFHPRSASRHLAVRVVEALERLLAFAEDPDRPLPKVLQGRPEPPPEDLTELRREADRATGLLQTVDPGLWEESAYYRIAVAELGTAVEQFMHQVWSGLQTPMRDWPLDLELFRYGYFSHEEARDWAERQNPPGRVRQWLKRSPRPVDRRGPSADEVEPNHERR